jgi:hypothetical protein
MPEKYSNPHFLTEIGRLSVGIASTVEWAIVSGSVHAFTQKYLIIYDKAERIM